MNISRKRALRGRAQVIAVLATKERYGNEAWPLAPFTDFLAEIYERGYRDALRDARKIISLLPGWNFPDLPPSQVAELREFLKPIR